MATAVDVPVSGDDAFSGLPWPCTVRILQLLPLRYRLIMSSVSKHFNEHLRDACRDISSLDVNDLAVCREKVFGQQASGILDWALRTNLTSLKSITASGHSCLEPLLKACQMPAGQATLAQLTSLQLDSVMQLQDKHLAELLPACPNLQLLSLPRCGKLTDASAGAIGRLLPRLREVSCRDWASLTDAGVIAMAGGCTQLEDVALDGCFRVGSEALAAVARGCPRLRRLSIAKSYAVTDAALAALGEFSGASLEELCLRQCPRVAAVWLLSRCTRLTSLDLSGCANVTGPGLLALLSGISGGAGAGGAGVGGGDIGGTGGGGGCGPSLRSLHLNGCVGVEGGCLAAVGRLCPGLRALSLRGLPLNDRHLRELAASGCCQLRNLGIAWCTRVTEEGLRPLLEANNQLRDLDMEALYLVGDSLLAALARAAPQLERAVLRLCHRLTAEGLLQLVAGTEVRSLLVSGVLDEAGTSDLVARVRRLRPDCGLSW